ncbi:Leucine rich repeat-containing protein [Acetitomaculum ruminis DSM 5522]|uniref:Leucine rich repeat-containing protein n=1 Tax=Acetitomaculum ruminis DSM 5522 TaxID=1120918 RepID=A0A1I0ZXN9_9FIRM|nr:leucine-rich repeat domain-containing protein [Acetitomaculum ruminis]SFB29846.1 Leucine rich repeat-containing protein [Acetitomaculum ruminis DSM 5522]
MKKNFRMLLLAISFLLMALFTAIDVKAAVGGRIVTEYKDEENGILYSFYKNDVDSNNKYFVTVEFLKEKYEEITIKSSVKIDDTTYEFNRIDIEPDGGVSSQNLKFEEGYEVINVGDINLAFANLENIEFPKTLQKVEGNTRKNGEKEPGWLENLYNKAKTSDNEVVYKDQSGVLYVNKIALYIKALPEVKSITIKEGTKVIAPYAACDDIYLESITIPDSVEEIEGYAFSGDNSLKEVIFTKDSNLKKLGYGVFGYQIVNDYERSGFTEDFAASGEVYRYDKDGNPIKCGAPIEKITLPAKALSYDSGVGLFNGCTTLKNIEFYPCKDDTALRIGYQFFGYCHELTSITIPDNVDKIEGFAFLGTTSLKTIDISEKSHIKKIGYGAFGYGSSGECTIVSSQNRLGCGVTTINIPGEVFRNTPVGMFNGSKYLTNINILDVEDNSDEQKEQYGFLAFRTFKDCKALNNVTIPAFIEKIENEAFYGASALTDLTIADGSKLNSFGYGTFGYGDYGEIENGSGVPLSSIKIPIAALRTSYYDNNTGLFNGCKTLNSVTFANEGYKYQSGDNIIISYQMFKDCSSLKSIDLPNEVRKISTRAFSGCTSLSTFTIHEDSMLERIEHEAFGWKKAGIKTFLGIDSIRFESGLIDDASGFGVSNISKEGAPITEIYIPAATILENSESYTSYGCFGLFCGNSSLKKVTFGDSTKVKDQNITKYVNISGQMFAGCTSLTTIEGLNNVDGILAGAFAGDKALKTVDLNNVKRIDYLSFAMTGLEEITLPESINYVGFAALASCTDLKTINIDTVNVGRNSYYDQPALKDICALSATNISPSFDFGTNKDYESTEAYAKAFPLLTKVENVNISAKEKEGRYITILETYSQAIGDYYGFLQQIPSLKRVNIGQGATVIPAHSFAFDYNLEEVNIPDSVTEIGNRAFIADTKLDLNLARLKNLKRVGSGAFLLVETDGSTQARNDYSVNDLKGGFTNIILPEGVKLIGDGAFFGQRNVQKIYIPSSVENIGHGAFIYNNALKELVVDADLDFSVENFNGYFFNEFSSSLENVKISGKCNAGMVPLLYGLKASQVDLSGFEGVTQFPENSFNDMVNLKSIILPSTLSIIKQGSFDGTTSLKSVVLPRSVNTIELNTFRNTYNYKVCEKDGETVTEKELKNENGQEIVVIKNPNAIIYYPVAKPVITGDELYGEASNEEVRLEEHIKAVEIEVPEKYYTDEEKTKEYLDEYLPFESDTVLVGYKGSAASEYADKFGLKFVDIESLNVEKEVEPTEENYGYTTYSASVDGAKYNFNEYTYPKKHNLKYVEEEKAADCLHEGKTAYYECQDCHKKYADPSGVLELSDAEITTVGNHVLEKVTEEEGKDCKHKGSCQHYKCKLCKKLFSDSLGLNEITQESIEKDFGAHTTTKVERKEATCSKDGNIEYYVCSVCGKYFEDKAATKEIADKTSVIIKKSGHKYNKPVFTWDKKKWKAKAVFTCSKCKNKVTKTATVTKTIQKATAKKDGKIIYVAKVKFDGKNYENKITKAKIAKISSVTLSDTKFVYNGKAKKPLVIVKDSNKKVINKKYYTVSYSNNKKVGKASVTVTFKGNYSGKITKKFTIVKAKTTKKKSVSKKTKKTK